MSLPGCAVELCKGANLEGRSGGVQESHGFPESENFQGAQVSDGIQRLFSAPAASHDSGVWERLIRSVRPAWDSPTADNLL